MISYYSFFCCIYFSTLFFHSRQSCRVEVVCICVWSKYTNKFNYYCNKILNMMQKIYIFFSLYELHFDKLIIWLLKLSNEKKYECELEKKREFLYDIKLNKEKKHFSWMSLQNNSYFFVFSLSLCDDFFLVVVDNFN